MYQLKRKKALFTSAAYMTRYCKRGSRVLSTYMASLHRYDGMIRPADLLQEGVLIYQ
jgi:hypothetical protein